MKSAEDKKTVVTYREALRVWLRVALLSFGGPAGQIAVMHKILVEEKKWIDENRFLHALNYCMFLPGPEAQQLATYIGWLLHRTRGGLTAGLLFILPGFLSILALSIVYALFQQVQWVEALFFGLTSAVLAVVVEAVLRIGKKALKNEVMVSLAILAFVGIFFFNLPFPVIIFTAAAVGFLGGKIREDKFYVIRPKAVSDADLSTALAIDTKPSWGRSLTVIGIWGAIWFVPLLALFFSLGAEHVLVQEAVFFSKTAVVTFGGAYSVLSYIAQQAVHTFAWLNPGEMLTGLGMAETTPGPLIQVVQFVGFMGAYRNPAPFDPMTAGILGSIVSTWMTFAPCFLWVFLGAPWIEHLRSNKALSTALSAVTAAVVGVIMNLALWFFLHVIFARVDTHMIWKIRLLVPQVQTIDFISLFIALGALIAMLKFKQNMIVVLAISAVAGIAFKFFLAV
jgi:chromate transporter